ncbi:MAG: phasin family protein [Rhizobiales bacterium]|nr:phasin family protein [Hyphomicrobiales bacterium]
MTNDFDITKQMRDFAEQGMDQARKAFDTYLQTMQGAVGNTEGSGNALQAQTSEAGKKALSLAEEQMNAAFSHTEKLVKAKDPKEVMDLQTAFLQEQMSNLTKQAQEMGEDAAKAVKDMQTSFKA